MHIRIKRHLYSDDKDMDLGSAAGLQTHLQQVITYALILLRPLFTPNPTIWCLKMLSLLLIRRKVPETPSQKCNPLWFLSNSCNPEFRCFFHESWGQGRFQFRAATLCSGVPCPGLKHSCIRFQHFWSILPNLFIFMVTTCLGRDSGIVDYIMMHSGLWVRENNLFNWKATNVTNRGLGELGLVALFKLAFV